MQPLVDYHDNTCPKCNAAIEGGGKTCGSCGAARRRSKSLVWDGGHMTRHWHVDKEAVFDKTSQDKDTKTDKHLGSSWLRNDGQL
ncbi:hypothetical protein NOF04DRAFT_17578 [Fusarium oxysporum II5]|uniref:Uncharacterized protein n=2 Tax=Fusarium oxysporum species complex TaxID=171631 RepID=X0JXS3_FUSO5|nr:uncharacterized protein FOIG_04483 [Fusarium odoratissimum NRRL 54006]EXM06094.1 hypothetical protein FOIG_04483 [Fusarium odoratissimum NRRL 54006]KAK2125770.1 hypothetical protein NOF04DRAFT_17578 [Fusarium oxysporum II5]TXC00412.1 hypothetical protein FocTR4_00013956 [Fusarium oxysporum f. sp. cubense]